MLISEIKSNQCNPRLIKDEKFKSLVRSLKDFPEMMELRPIVVDEKNIALGGNMRLKALIELGYKEIPNTWVIKASDLSEEQKQEFIIKDNVGFGEWDWDILANEWDGEKLVEWGLDVPIFVSDEEKSQKQEEELKPYVKTHVLLSFSPQKIQDIKPYLDEILKIDGIEYEQASN